MDPTAAHPPAGQERLPWLTPRPTAASTVQLLRDGVGRLHADFGCARTPAADVEAVRIGKLGGVEQLCYCLHRCDVDGLLAAVRDPDRRAALVGWNTRSWRGPDRRVACEVAGAGVVADGEDGRRVAALPLPVAKWVRDLCYAELVRVRTVDAAGIVGTVAALWTPDAVEARHQRLEDAARTARRLLVAVE